MLIDEYDNFANTVLAHHGEEAYQAFTHGGGFYRDFFSALKAGAARGSGGLDRLFITGVSPITMDDVTSGFNIGADLSLGAGPERDRVVHRAGRCGACWSSTGRAGTSTGMWTARWT